MVSATMVTVVVVFNSPKGMIENIKNQTLVANAVKSILRTRPIIKGAVVLLDQCDVAQMYDIHCIRVVDTRPQREHCRMKLSRSTSLKIQQTSYRSSHLLKENEITLGGLHSPQKRLREIITRQQAWIKRVLIAGPSGCGKTSLVHSVTANCRTELLQIDGSVLEQSESGAAEKSLKEAFAEAREISKVSPCVLLLENVEMLCPNRQLCSKSQSRVTSQLLALLESVAESENLTAVATSSRIGDLDPAFRRSGCTDEEIYINVPDGKERCAILQQQLKSLPKCKQDLVDTIAKMTPGFIGADLKLVVKMLAHLSEKKSSDEFLSLDDVKYVLSQVEPSSLKGAVGMVDYQPMLWEDIGGMDHVKKELKKAIEWPLKYPEAFFKLGVPPSRGVLLYGPPGCAKTTLARAAATATNTTFLAVTAAELYSPYVGDSEKAVVELFHRARMGAPTILFLDEIDSLVGKRSMSEKHHGVQEKVLCTLLNEMDGVGVHIPSSQARKKVLEGQGDDNDQIQMDSTKVDNTHVMVIAATNRPDMLDSALIRPGRLDRLIYIPAPDINGRLKILGVLTQKMPLEKVDLFEVAQRTELFSGADLVSLCREAAFSSLVKRGMNVETILHKDFLTALEVVNPSLTQQQVDWYEAYRG